MLIWKKSRDYFPIAYGMTSLDKFERNVYQGIRFLKKEISPEQFLNMGPDMGTTMDPTVDYQFKNISY